MEQNRDKSVGELLPDDQVKKLLYEPKQDLKKSIFSHMWDAGGLWVFKDILFKKYAQYWWVNALMKGDCLVCGFRYRNPAVMDHKGSFHLIPQLVVIIIIAWTPIREIHTSHSPLCCHHVLDLLLVMIFLSTKVNIFLVFFFQTVLAEIIFSSNNNINYMYL